MVLIVLEIYRKRNVVPPQNSKNTRKLYETLKKFFQVPYNSRHKIKIVSYILITVYVDQNVIHSFNALFPVSKIIWKLEGFLKNKNFLQ